MTSEQKVAEGILDAEEYLEINLASEDAVRDYAESVQGVDANAFDAEKVLKVCRNWVTLCKGGVIPGSNDYYWTVTIPLSGHA